MANTKISALTAVTSVGATDVVPVVQGGVTMKTTPALLINQLGSANNPITSASAARPTGLTKVFWQCATQPMNWVAGDEWINNA